MQRYTLRCSLMEGANLGTQSKGEESWKSSSALWVWERHWTIPAVRSYMPRRVISGEFAEGTQLSVNNSTAHGTHCTENKIWFGECLLSARSFFGRALTADQLGCCLDRCTRLCSLDTLLLLGNREFPKFIPILRWFLKRCSILVLPLRGDFFPNKWSICSMKLTCRQSVLHAVLSVPNIAALIKS